MALATCHLEVKKSPKTAGYTILELMITVGIIGISVSLAAPAVQQVMANRRSQEVSLELVRLGRRARSEAMAYGRAHLLRFSASADSGHGRIDLYRGINNGCNTNDWTFLTGGPACGEDDSMCIDSVTTGAFSKATSTVYLTSATYTALDLCYSANGVMMWRTSTSARFSDIPPSGTNTFDFSFAQKVDGKVVGVSRPVIFPMGGLPRTQR
jgi:Tfp pilus assembly protein FimT